MSVRKNGIVPDCDEIDESPMYSALEQLKRREIPYSYPELNWYHNYHLIRDNFIRTAGFVLLANNWLEPLSRWIGNRKCLEVMSGCGSLTYALLQQGVDIRATDNYSWDGFYNWSHWVPVEDIDAVEAVRQYGANIDIIIMAWPYMDNTAYRVLETMREVNPNCLMIYIGESDGGCTAEEDFFESMTEVLDTEFEQAVLNYQSWTNVHDRIYLIK